MSRFVERTLPDGTKTIYHIKSNLYARKSTDLVPPLKVHEPKVKRKRQRWLQDQKDTTKFIKLP